MLELWEPLHAWVSTAHPDDAAAMYVDDTRERITADSIPLWEQRTQEYGRVAQDPYVAEATQICGAATDRLVRSGDADGPVGHDGAGPHRMPDPARGIDVSR